MPQHEQSIDISDLILAVYEELKGILLSYSGVIPPELIEIGKAALSGPGKVMSTRVEPGEGATRVRAPRWPLAVALSCLAASTEAERADWRKAVPAAAAVEIAMAAADLLDEIADDDPSAVVARYGTGQALNAANLMLVMAQQSLLRRALSDDSSSALLVLDTLQSMLVEAAVGQHLDMRYEKLRPDEVTVEMSADMTAKKAGALISGACRMGALSSGACAEVVEVVARFGREIGSIAQVENDLRDVLPYSKMQPQTGQVNPVQKTDLQRRKRTLPIVFALRDDSEEPNALQIAYSSDSGAVDEELLRETVQSAGGIAFGELLIRVYRENALAALEELELLRPGSKAILRPLLPEVAED